MAFFSIYFHCVDFLLYWEHTQGLRDWSLWKRTGAILCWAQASPASSTANPLQATSQLVIPLRKDIWERAQNAAQTEWEGEKCEKQQEEHRDQRRRRCPTVEQMCPAALGRHTLENSEEERPIERNCCALINQPPAPVVPFMKGPNVT